MPPDISQIGKTGGYRGQMGQSGTIFLHMPHITRNRQQRFAINIPIIFFMEKYGFLEAEEIE